MWTLCSIDRLLGCSFKDDVFGLFRAWYLEGAAGHIPWSRQVLLMDCVTDCRVLISDLYRSLGNIGTRITLEDFTLDQVRELCGRYGVRANNDVARLYSIVGGHPYLVHTSLQAIRSQRISLHRLEGEAERDDGLFAMHLERLLGSLSEDTALAESMAQILTGFQPIRTECFRRLRAAGLVVGASPQDAQLRCKLYETYFKRQLQAGPVPDMPTEMMQATRWRD